MPAAGIVLAGGRSTRMGRDKASLPWRGTTLVAYVCGVLHRAVDGPVVVVGAAGQQLPELPPWAEVATDPACDLGPVQGVAAGLAAVAGRADMAFVAATDLALLDETVVRFLLGELGARPEAQVVVPVVDGHRQLLASAYRVEAADSLRAALARGERRLRAAVTGLRLHDVPAPDLLDDGEVRRADPSLASFTNLNDPQAYARARAPSRG